MHARRAHKCICVAANTRKAVIALVLWITLGFAVACSPSSQYKRVDLKAFEQPSTSPVAAQQTTVPPLRVAVSSMVSPKETFTTYQDLIQYLGARMNRPVQLVERKTYAEVNDLIQSGGVDVAFVCSQSYVQGQQRFGLELLAAPEVRGEALYRAYIIVPVDSQVTQFDQLRGKVFAFTDPDSNTGRLVPSYLLWQKHESPEGFFRETVYTYSHDNSMKAVAGRLVDGASVDSLAYDYTLTQNAGLASRTRIIYRSDPFGSPPAVVPPGLPEELKRQLRETLLGMDSDYRGKTILASLMIDRFVIPDQTAYEPIREMLRKVQDQR